MVTEEEDGYLIGGTDVIVVGDDAAGLRVGVADLDVGFNAGTFVLLIGVDDFAVGLAVGVEDLGITVGLAEGKVAREVGVDDLVGLDMGVDINLDVVVNDAFEPVFSVGLGADVKAALDVVLNAGHQVGVEGLNPPDEEGLPPDEEGLRSPAVEVVNPGDEVGCLDDKLLLTAGSVRGFASLDFKAKGRALGVPS